jgi:deoxyribodipyrimidine photo-lyase
MFTTNIQEIEKLVDAIDPVKYAKTRNFIDGAVTKLSPYISRGVISTKYILDKVLSKGYKLHQIEKFVQELAWRDYYQQVWIAKGNLINEDLRQQQPDVANFKIAQNIIQAQIGIDAIDDGIKALYETGYMHNHNRMYTASIACNIAKSHWKVPAQWLYYYLLDADWASNALSWQWVASAFSSKKYYANQENINKYCYSKQRNTFLDVEYEAFENMEIPSALQQITDFTLTTNLPEKEAINNDNKLPTLVYNFYNVDPYWKSDIQANRILLLEPSFFTQYPVCDKTINFMINLAKNIEGIQVFVGEFKMLEILCNQKAIYYKEHPTNQHYIGLQESRDWLVKEVTGFYPSFFGYWKKMEKQF